MNICKYKYFEKQCVVKYCKTCVPGNNYYCQECLPANYEVSALTGGCVRKVDKSPAVYFKDIFRFKLNQYKQIGARTYYGPFFSLRGVTNSQINTGHAFLVLMSFKLHYTRNNRNRYLEENKDIKTYCQIVESVDESDESNVVDFDCIGDTEEEEDLSEYDLNGIEESKDTNTSIFEESNLNDLVQTTDLSSLALKTKPSFDLKSFIGLAIFSPDEVNNITSEDYHFNLKLNGKLNQDLQEQSLNVQIPLNQIKDKKVGCTFNIKTDRNADLSCDLNLEEYKVNNYTQFSLKVTEIKDSSDTPIYLSRINEAKLIHEIEETNEVESKEEDDDDNNKKKVGLIVGVVIGSVAFVVIVAFIVREILHRKNKGQKIQENNDKSENIPNIKKVEEAPESNRQVIPFQN